MGDIPRKLLRGLVGSLVAACLAATVFGCAYSPNIWVHGLDSGDIDRFSFKVDNSTLSQSDKIDEFKVGSTKNALFDGLREGYQVFAESEDRIQLIYHNQIYTVRHYGDGHYALYGELFWVRGRDGEFRNFPFPTDKLTKIAGGDPDRPQPVLQGTELTVNCDLPYLLRFYEVYGDAVTVEGNRITYGRVRITVEAGGLIEVEVL